MSRVYRAFGLFLLIVLLALPASAVTSSRISRNSGWGFLSTLWGAVSALFSGETTDGRCGADPWGICSPSFSGETTDGRCGLDPDGRCLPEGGANS
jgi:hypothetical protein